MQTPRIQPRHSESEARARRIVCGRQITVESRTIGAPMTYVLSTDNLSRTGLLLNAGKNLKVPFRVNTLLELTVDADGMLTGQPVHCLGRIVRVQTPPGEAPSFGIQIVQMEDPDQDAWESLISRFESHGGRNPALPQAGEG